MLLIHKKVNFYLKDCSNQKQNKIVTILNNCYNKWPLHELEYI